jgi:hypothetical protein
MVCVMLDFYTLSDFGIDVRRLGLGPNEQVLPEDADRIYSPKRCVLK